MRIGIVGRKHFVCGTSFDERLDSRMRRFWDTRHLDLVEADAAVIAIERGSIVGFLRYLAGSYSAFPALFGLGTYVLPGFRNRGLAAKMWGEAIHKVQPAFATVYLTSRPSARLVASLQRRHPDVVFYTCRDFK